ncbi:hypothetical protein J6I39_01655 [bacterium]|nr:hypothetical protein [bacterium]
MGIDESILEKQIDEIDGKLEEIKALNEVITEFIEDVQDIEKNSKVILRDRAYRVIFFANMIHDKSVEISNDINKLIPCQQST